jgi:hypothetical protein
MDSETKKILIDRITLAREASQAASICGFDIAARQLLDLANELATLGGEQ